MFVRFLIEVFIFEHDSAIRCFVTFSQDGGCTCPGDVSKGFGEISLCLYPKHLVVGRTGKRANW